MANASSRITHKETGQVITRPVCRLALLCAVLDSLPCPHRLRGADSVLHPHNSVLYKCKH